MARDEEFHELVTRCPEALLALLGITPRGPYRGDAPVVKAERRIDGVLTPLEPGDGPRVYLEMQLYADPEIELRFLEEIVLHCRQVGRREEVRAVILFSDPALAADVLSADVGSAEDPLIRFRPTRLVLSTVSAKSSRPGEGPPWSASRWWTAGRWSSAVTRPGSRR